MNRKGAMMKLVLIGIVIISVVLIGGVSFLYQNEVSKNNKLQAQVDELTAREKITEGKLDTASKKVSELTLKLQETKDRIASITEELDKEKSAHQAVAKELDQVKSDMEQQKAGRQDVENKLAQAENDGRQLKEQLKTITQQKADLEIKIKNMESSANGVELGKVVVNSEATAIPNAKVATTDKKVTAPAKVAAPSQVKPLEGKVTVVNKEYNFAVINLGQKDGINIGDQFSVSRDGKIIGDLKVEKVHESMSAAGFAAELKDLIKENDSVVQKAK